MARQLGRVAEGGEVRVVVEEGGSGRHLHSRSVLRCGALRGLEQSGIPKAMYRGCHLIGEVGRLRLQILLVICPGVLVSLIFLAHEQDQGNDQVLRSMCLVLGGMPSECFCDAACASLRSQHGLLQRRQLSPLHRMNISGGALGRINGGSIAAAPRGTLSESSSARASNGPTASPLLYS